MWLDTDSFAPTRGDSATSRRARPTRPVTPSDIHWPDIVLGALLAVALMALVIWSMRT